MGRSLMLLTVLAGLGVTSAVKAEDVIVPLTSPTGSAFQPGSTAELPASPFDKPGLEKQIVGTWKTWSRANFDSKDDGTPSVTLVLKADGTFELSNPAVNDGKPLSGTYLLLRNTINLNHGKETLSFFVDLQGDSLTLEGFSSTGCKKIALNRFDS